jgi:polysaccharide chain length determinant protein (PEP-CTERM system associated)
MVGILRRRLVVALVAFATVIAGAAAFAVYLPDLYQAHATVIIERPLGDTVRPGASDNLENRLYAIQSTILSRDRLTELIERFNLYPELRQKGSQDEVLTQAREDIKWKPNGPEQVSGRNKTVTFTLTYTGDERKTVADVTNAIAGFYGSYNGQMRSAEAENMSGYYKTQMDAAAVAANASEVKLNTFITANQAQLPQAAGVGAATYARLSDQLTQIRNEQTRITILRDQIQADLDANAQAVAESGAASGAAVPGFEPSPQLRQLREDLAKAKDAVAANERKGFTDEHPDMRDAKDSVARLDQAVKTKQAEELAAAKARAEERASAAGTDGAAKAAVARLMPRSQRSIEGYNEQLKTLAKSEADIKVQMDQMMQRLDSAPAVQTQYVVLQRELESKKEAYDQALRKYQEAKQMQQVESSGQAERFTVLEAAIVPEGPSAPNRPRLLIMGFLLALAAAAAAVVAREQFDTSFHSIDEVREFTSIPVIASIPQIGKAPRRGYLRLAFGTVSAVAAIVLVGTLSAYVANGNEALVRILNRAG